MQKAFVTERAELIDNNRKKWDTSMLQRRDKEVMVDGIHFIFIHFIFISVYISYMYHFRAGWQSLQPGHEPSYSHLGCTCHTVLMVKNDRGWIARKRFTQECRRISSLHFFFPQQHFITYILHFSSPKK